MLGLLNIARKWPFLIDAKKNAIFCNIRQTKQCMQKCNIPICAHEKILTIFIKKVECKKSMDLDLLNKNCKNGNFFTIFCKPSIASNSAIYQNKRIKKF